MSTASRYPQEPTFKPRGRRITYQQVDTLIDHLAADRELVKGYSNSRAGRYRGQKAWEMVASSLNRIPGGARKNPKRWSAFWSNYKNKLKNRVRLVQAAKNNGQESTTKLTELDLKLIPILGPEFSLDTVMKCEYSPVKLSPAGSPPCPASPAPPSSPDTLPSPPSPPPPIASAAATTRKPRIRPRKRPLPNGASSGSDSDRSALARLYAQAEDRAAAALLRLAQAVDALAAAAQAQAQAARATAQGMQAIARALAHALPDRLGTANETNTNTQ